MWELEDIAIPINPSTTKHRRRENKIKNSINVKVPSRSPIYIYVEGLRMSRQREALKK